MTSAERETLYTLRWTIRERWGSPEGQQAALDLLGQLLEPQSKPDQRPSLSTPAQKLLWYPPASTDFPPAITQGAYRKGYPEGAIVHFTAGHHRPLRDEINQQLRNRFCYFVIDADGNVAQNFPLSDWGYHAGESKWPGLGSSVSRFLVGIEVMSGGLLKKVGDHFETWFGKTIPAAQIRTAPRDRDNIGAGSYQKFTPAQEDALLHLLRWLRSNNPDVFRTDLVLGHDEVSGPSGLGYRRKNDPGAALSMSMPDLRRTLENLS